MEYPEWVNRHKTKGTNISRIKGKYYLYSVSSKWNKAKKRSQKITKEYLGRITEAGLIPPKAHKEEKPSVTVKKYGAASLLMDIGQDILEKLRIIFPRYGETLFTIAAIRLIEHCPFRRMELHYENSYLSEVFKGINLCKTYLTDFLRIIGSDREKIVLFMDRFIQGNSHILFDATNIAILIRICYDIS